ncbi:MAG: hypothetical protein ACJARL_002763 [Halopseudomonas sp.]|jgi:hypothetical protein
MRHVVCSPSGAMLASYDSLLNAIKNGYHLVGVNSIQAGMKVRQHSSQRKVDKNATNAIVSQLTTLPIICRIQYYCRSDSHSSALIRFTH